MKYAGKTFTLYASEPVAVQGSDSLYTYQNTGTGTATLQGSNNGKDWVTITTVTSGASSISSHSYAFLRMTGSTEVSVSRGEAGSGSTLLNGSAVSSSNPLPVINEQKFSGALQVSGGRMWECPLITKAGVSTKYSAICIFNPTETDLRMMSIALTAWGGSATQMRLVKTIIDPSTLPLVWTQQTGVFANALVKVADSRVCPFKVYTASLDTLDDATWLNTNNTSTTPIGSNVRGESKIFEKGTGLILVCVTANITLNAYAEMAEESE